MGYSCTSLRHLWERSCYLNGMYDVVQPPNLGFYDVITPSLQGDTCGQKISSFAPVIVFFFFLLSFLLYFRHF